MRILRPHGNGFVSLTPGEAILSSLFRGLFALLRFIILTTAMVLAWMALLLWRGTLLAWQRYWALHADEPPENVVRFERKHR